MLLFQNLLEISYKSPLLIMCNKRSMKIMALQTCDSEPTDPRAVFSHCLSNVSVHRLDRVYVVKE